MKKWLIGATGYIILVFLIWATVSCALDRPKLERPHAPEQSIIIHQAAPWPQPLIAWADWIQLPRRHRPRRNPRRRLKKRKHTTPGRRRLRSTERFAEETAQRAERQASHEAEPAPSPPSAEERKPGRPATIPTDHLYCPNKHCVGYGKIGPHPDHHIVGAGTYLTLSGRRQMYKCQLCGKRFSETQGTVFFGLKTPAQTVYRALACLAEGQGIRSVARVFEVDKDTVQAWLKRAGEHSEQVSDYLIRGLHLTEIQLDELWSFVRKKEDNLTAWEKLQTEYGDTWVWVAFDPVYKLVASHVVGEQKKPEAKALLTKLKSRLAEGVVPLFTSDQLAHYVEAILETFGRLEQPERKGKRGRFPNPRWVPGPNLCYATVVKEREKGRVVSITTRIVFGTARKVWARIKASPVSRAINTAFVERMNGTLRHLSSRLHRKTFCFSKKREGLEHHLELVIAYYHLVLPHKSLRLRLPEPIPTNGNGSPKKWKQCQ